jgi:hypothetical protein
MDVEGTSTTATASAKNHSIRRVLGVNESIELVETGGV